MLKKIITSLLSLCVVAQLAITISDTDNINTSEENMISVASDLSEQNQERPKVKN